MAILNIFAALETKAFSGPKLGDAEWMTRFREFVKEFNDFILGLNDQRFDRAKWERVRSAWRRIEVD